MNENNYNWEYLEKVIPEYYGTYECFVECFEEEKQLGITYDAFRTQKKRKSAKYLNDFTTFIIDDKGTPFDKLNFAFSKVIDGFFTRISISKSITFEKEKSKFFMIKSWEKNHREECNIDGEFFTFFDELIQNKYLKEVFDEDEILLLIKEKITIYIKKKILLFDFIKFTLNKNTIDVEIKFNQITTSFPLDKEIIDGIRTSFPLNKKVMDKINAFLSIR